MNWSDVRGLVRDRKILSDEGERMMMLVELAATDGKTIPQRVELSRGHFAGQSWVALWADVAPGAEIEPRRALVHNAGLGLGSVAIDGDHYFLRHTVLLADLTGPQLDLVIKLVAHEAARLRGRRALCVDERADQEVAAAWAD
jgi:hypothetical protein